MNKFLNFIIICVLIAGCDLKSKSETEDQKTDGKVEVITAPASPVNSQPVQQSPTSVTTENNPDVKTSLYGVWVLQAQNNAILDPAEYKSGMPYIRFDSATRKISGSTGCRGINGSFEISRNRLSTSVISLSEGKCGLEKFENFFISFFSAKNQVYEFRSGLLFFPGADGKNFTFRKIQ
jgi:heat shock protein HslJ